ncbi:MAG: serine/threonine protein kinase [Deltaproteobacteria bacterium]|nr:serine/threonine protein kinase [Deltaproteobacteria bacterium]
MEALIGTGLRVGTTVAEKYQVEKLLGAGGMGEVYQAEHVYTRRKVALKLVQASVARTMPAVEARFFQEAQAAASVRHTAITEVLDAGREADGTLYLVFELLDGQDLEAAFTTLSFRPADLVRIGVRLLDALAATHASGILHRDIKPANIFLARTPNGATQVKLLDFGIAKRMDADRSVPSERGAVVGTVEYMSPEQAAGVPLDARSDVWSVAAVLFRGLAGRPPFMPCDFHRMVLKVATEAAPSLADFRPDLPDDLIAAIDRALLRERTQRWASAEDMAQALALCDHAELHAAVPASQIRSPVPEGPSPLPDTYVRDTQREPTPETPARRGSTLVVRKRKGAEPHVTTTS